MGLISPTLPTIGQPNSTQDPDILSTLVALLGLVNGGLDTNNLSATANIAASQLAAGVIPAGATLTTGAMIMYPNASAPSGFLLCDGSAVSRSTFSALFAITGVAYGGGNGTTTFNVPDLVGRFPLGSGTAASPAVAGGTAHTLGAKGGEETHALTGGENGPHTHPDGFNTLVTAGGTHYAYLQAPADVDAQVSHGATVTGSSGSGTGHNNLPQFTVVNYIIKT